MNNHLYIVRGIPGSGKSTFARKLIARGMADVYYEADMFFEKNGRYQYDATKIGQAHAWCQNQVMRALHQGKNVVVSNTFTTISEILPYTRFCRQNHIPFQVVRLTTNFGSIHGVPADIIDRMKAQFQDWRGEMKIPQAKNESTIVNKIKEMKTMNENKKVTLTVKQLRSLVKEARVKTSDSDFEIEGGVLVKYRGRGGDVVIPRGVKSIGAEAFRDCESLTSVTIPSSVTRIGMYAFSRCRSLTSVMIPYSVTRIEAGAFCGCDGLTSVTIPDSVTSIGDEAFWYCSSLTSVTIPDSVIQLGRGAFSKCSKLKNVKLSRYLFKKVVDSMGQAFAYTPFVKKLRRTLAMTTDETFDRLIKEGSEEITEYDNPYELENCRTYGWVAYIVKDGFAWLPIDFSLPANIDTESDRESAELRRNAVKEKDVVASGIRVDMSGYDGPSNATATFFMTARAAKNAVSAAEIDGGGACSNQYLYDAMRAKIIKKRDYNALWRKDFEFDIDVIDTYVCGDGTVILGSDALEDNAEEWYRENEFEPEED